MLLPTGWSLKCASYMRLGNSISRTGKERVGRCRIRSKARNSSLGTKALYLSLSLYLSIWLSLSLSLTSNTVALFYSNILSPCVCVWSRLTPSRCVCLCVWGCIRLKLIPYCTQHLISVRKQKAIGEEARDGMVCSIKGTGIHLERKLDRMTSDSLAMIAGQ